MKKIIVLSKYVPYAVGVDVNSRFYDAEMNPIIISDEGGNSYHLGQISSSWAWAKLDMTYERYKEHFDKLFPMQNGKFEFEYILQRSNQTPDCGLI